jgi:hypothetical protein
MNPFARAVIDKSPSHPFQDNIVSFSAKQLPPEEGAPTSDSDFMGTVLAELAAGIGDCEEGPTNSMPVVGASIGPVTSKGNLSAGGGQFRKELSGGTYEPDVGLSLLNSRFFLAKAKGAYPIAQIDGGSIKYLALQDFRTKLANMFVRTDDGRGGKKKTKAETFWLEHEHRQEREIIFNPEDPPGDQVDGKYNLWRGFAVEPRRVSGKQRRLLRHISEVICRNEKAKFKYLIFWLAWAVQNPDKNPETAIVLKSANQGTGKTTLGYSMRKIFGEHARTISDKQRLFDKFNADLETAVFVDADEMLWAGDRNTADSLKSLITSDSLTLEVKHGSRWPVPNRLHIVMTTNHEHAVQAGVQDRRFFVLDVSPHKAQDESWFAPLYADLDSGGIEEFLWLLLKIRLNGWHPRKLPKTTEAIEQQRFSADSVSQWVQACVDADGIVGCPGVITYPLNGLLPSNVLYDAYKGHCKYHPVSNVVFGKALTQMLGEPSRQKVGASSGKSRPRTYQVPDAEKWQRALDQRLGISIGARR